MRTVQLNIFAHLFTMNNKKKGKFHRTRRWHRRPHRLPAQRTLAEEQAQLAAWSSISSRAWVQPPSFPWLPPPKIAWRRLCRLHSWRSADGVRPWRHEEPTRDSDGRSWCGAAGGGGQSSARVCGGADGRGVVAVRRGRWSVRAADAGI